MKRFEGIIKSEVLDGEIKRSKFQADEEYSEPESITNEPNPFLVEPVLRKLLKLVDTSKLKILRKICQFWDQISVEELENRAFNGKLKAIDLCWTKKFQIKFEAEANLVRFLRDTQSIPRVFSSFKVDFPQSWVIFSNHMEFFSIYPITFIHLDIPSYLGQEEIHAYFSKFMQSDIWRNLKGITISTISQTEIKFGPASSFLFVYSSGNMPKMQQIKFKKLDIQVSSPQILEIFKSTFASGILMSLRLASLPTGNLNFPGLDLSKLTRLEIGQIGDGSSPALKFASGLINLSKNGMILKNFGISFNLTPNPILGHQKEEFFEHLRIIFNNFTQFLSAQSSTLATLSFGVICHLDTIFIDIPKESGIWCKIHLPNFEVLHTLKLKANFKLIEASPIKIHTKLFGMNQSLFLHFPKLVNLSLFDVNSLLALRVNPAPDEAGGFELKRLKIPLNNADDPSVWKTSLVGVISSVEELTCPSGLRFKGIFPWDSEETPSLIMGWLPGLGEFL